MKLKRKPLADKKRYSFLPSQKIRGVAGQKEEASIIGASTLFRGQVRGHGSFTVQGQVEGTVGIEGLISVEHGGTLNADARATRARVAGSLVGSVQTLKTLFISATGYVEGKARAGRLQVEEGGVLRGRVVRGKTLPDRRTPPKSSR